MTSVRFPLVIMILLLCMACRQGKQYQTTVIQNVYGYTFYDGDLRPFSAITFSDGKVVDVYSDTTFESTAGSKIIDGDFFKVSAIEIWQTKVLETWVAGHQVYSSTDK